MAMDGYLMKANRVTTEAAGTDQADATTGSVLDTTIRQFLDEHGPEKPQLFQLKTRLPVKGRGSALMAATDRMWVTLKTYAEGGENTLHAHPNEDHVFIVMQGRATFYGPDDESVTFEKHEGIMLPHGCKYYFLAEPGEPLVLLRIGCVYDAAKTPWGRVGRDGKPLKAVSKENRNDDTEFGDAYFE